MQNGETPPRPAAAGRRVWRTLTAALLLAAATPAAGRVFWRRPAPRGRAVLDTTPGWARLLAGPALINGGEGMLEVFGCDQAPPAVIARLARAYPAAADWQTGDTLAVGRVVEDGAHLTFLALSAELPDRCVLFALRMAPEAAGRAGHPPETPAPGEPAPYPGSRALERLAFDATGIAWSTWDVPADAASALAHYDRVLRGDGWQRVDPGPDADAPSGLRLYRNARRLCLLRASGAPDSADTRITVLHKQLDLD